MKITITPTGGQPFLLADDSVSVVIGPTFTGRGGRANQGRVCQQTETTGPGQPAFPGGAYALLIPRFNLQNRFSFTVQRSFQSVENCIGFIAFHPDSVPTQGEITLDNQSATGRILRYLPSAVIETVECAQHIGLSCNFTYTISGNGAWQSSP